MTVVTGLSTSFTTMLLARFGVAVGEAGGLPTTHALAAEYFPASQRGKVLSTIAFFAAAGLTAATIAGGLIAEHWGWRTSFFVGGGVGLVVAVLMFLTVRDVNPPVALKAAATAPEASPRPGFRQGFAVLWKRKAFLHLCLGMAWGAFGSYAQLSWNAPFLMRAYHLTVGQVSESYGGVTAIATLLAILVGGFFSDIMTRHNARWPFWLLAVAFGFTLPAGLFTYLTHSYALVLALILPTTALASLWIGPAYALVQNLSGARLRATGAALFMLMSNLVGLGLGPSAVGVISDLLHPRFGDDSLRYALILASLTAIPATIHFLLATRSVEADIAEADADSN
jgi:MFS family permease